MEHWDPSWIVLDFGWEFGCGSLCAVEFNFRKDLAMEILIREISRDMQHLVIVIYLWSVCPLHFLWCFPGSKWPVLCTFEDVIDWVILYVARCLWAVLLSLLLVSMCFDVGFVLVWCVIWKTGMRFLFLSKLKNWKYTSFIYESLCASLQVCKDRILTLDFCWKRPRNGW